MNENQTPVTPEELNRFVDALSRKVNTESRTRYPTCSGCWTVVIAEPGKRYARLVSSDESMQRRSAYGFIDLTNGDILKAAGWKAPAKHARGNIRVGDFSNGWCGAVGVNGISYLR